MLFYAVKILTSIAKCFLRFSSRLLMHQTPHKIIKRTTSPTALPNNALFSGWSKIVNLDKACENHYREKILETHGRVLVVS